MSLRIRLVLWLGGVLAVTLGLGCALAGWHAVASVRAEIQSALATGRQEVANNIEVLAHAGPASASGLTEDTARRSANGPTAGSAPNSTTGSARQSGAAVTGGWRALRHLVATFDGNRHVRATLTDDRGRVIAVSVIQPPTRPVPAWFRRAIGPTLVPVVLRVFPDAISSGAISPGAVSPEAISPEASFSGAITLIADPTNEVGEVWDQANDTVRTLGLFFALAVLLIHWTVGRALQPLARMSAGFGRIGTGDYAARLDATGPPELMRLATGFNRMAEQLGDMEVQNRRLQEQLLTLQEEERSDLARDLHDEIGPLLFAAGIDAASISSLLKAGRLSETSERADAIGNAVTHIQAQIRSILGRLRPLTFGGVDLADVIDNLVEFWRVRRPGIGFVVDVAEVDDMLAEGVRATVCRVVQESLCNAVRHGDPKRIEISVTCQDADIVVQVANDGAGPGAAGVTPGFGLVGMRERVHAQAGTLAVITRPGGGGLTVTARLPRHAVACDAPAACDIPAVYGAAA